jgi:hypothetical protein
LILDEIYENLNACLDEEKSVAGSCEELGQLSAYKGLVLTDDLAREV